MDGPTDEEIEDGFKRVLAKLKARQDEVNGKGSFDHSVMKGKLMVKRADELTPEELAFLYSPSPKKQH